MAFELSDLELRFAHIPTDLHQFEDKHQTVTAIVLAAAAKLMETVPYGQDAEDTVTHLVHAANSAHAAIDKDLSTGNIRIAGKVVSPVGAGTPTAVEPGDAPSAVPEAPVAAPEPVA